MVVESNGDVVSGLGCSLRKILEKCALLVEYRVFILVFG
jgi:hypothetical protein